MIMYLYFRRRLIVIILGIQRVAYLEYMNKGRGRLIEEDITDAIDHLSLFF